jgi:DMSO/TMAO reductase YedYZ molybdopterin-dependent catalytic subunit
MRPPGPIRNPAAADEQGINSGIKNISSSSRGTKVVQHVWFEGYNNAGPDTHFLVSIPQGKALSEDGDVLLAVQMNGVPLPGQHGYPVRVVVPGHVGVRSCKWLKRIVLSQEEAPSH